MLAAPSMSAGAEPLRIAIVAGESSGDQLGAALITAMRTLVPNVQFFGMAGPRMIAAGCDAWAASEEIAVMGLTEVLPHLPRLIRLRASLVARFRAARPHVFVGIDSPAFNLGLAKKLRSPDCKTVQYVAPQVWAWRQGRVRGIGQACDLVLCLLPFETTFFERHGIASVFVGHPLADQIPLEIDREGARRALGIVASNASTSASASVAPNGSVSSAPAEARSNGATAASSTIVALLPGSRLTEVERLATDFITAAAWIAERRPDIEFISPMASHRVRQAFERKIAEVPHAPKITLFDGQAQRVLAAADAVIVASGTATLETLLSRRPMVVAYRFAAVTAFLLRRLGLVKVQYFSQPNLLVGRRLVPEFLQEQVNGPALGAALLRELDDRDFLTELSREFRAIHETLRLGGADRAASAILECVRGSGPVASDLPTDAAATSHGGSARDTTTSAEARRAPDADDSRGAGK
jgi:lipid-A-disaccharide synthase